MASTFSDLKIELIATGEQSGTWGTTTNTNLGTAIEQAITGSGDVPFSSADVTLTLTDTNASQTARNLRLNLTGTSGGARNLIVPAIEKQYIINNGLADAVTVKNSTGTGVAVPAGKTMVVFNNATDVVDVTTYASSLTLGAALPIASGGTNATATPTAGAITYGTGTAYAFNTAGTSGQALLSGGSGAPTFGTLGVASGGTGQTTYTDGQLLIGNSTGNTLAKSTLTAGSGVTITNGSGSITISATGSGGDAVLANNNAFTGANTFYNNTGQTIGTGTSTQDGLILAGRSGGSSSYRITLQPATLSSSTTLTLPNVTSTVAALGATQTFTALNTFEGTSSVLSSKFVNALEKVTVSATAATGTINYDVTTQSVLYYTSNAAANWTVNLRASSGTSLDSVMATGESITVAFLVTQGSTPYYNNALQVDGNAVTPKWQGGTAPTSGNASSIDAYVYTIVKTGAATFTVFASQTKFA